MQLLYLRVFESDMGRSLAFENLDLNFHGKHHFYWDETYKSIKYRSNENYCDNLYGEDLVKEFKALFPDVSIINRLLVGNYTNPDEIHKRPMAKYMQDIARLLDLF